MIAGTNQNQTFNLKQKKKKTQLRLAFNAHLQESLCEK